MIALPAKTRIWIAAGVTDLRRGFTGLSALVQTKLEQSPFSGQVFVFRGRRGDLIKVLWFDGDGLCLFAKRLERGRFVWPQAQSGTVSLTRAQLSMLLEGIDWRRPERTGNRSCRCNTRDSFHNFFVPAPDENARVHAILRACP
jgi:transposase